MNREFDDYINGTQRTISLMDREQERRQKWDALYLKTFQLTMVIFRELDKQLAEENLKMAEEQKSRKQFLEKVVYTNRPTPEYYDQFNKSTR